MEVEIPRKVNDKTETCSDNAHLMNPPGELEVRLKLYLNNPEFIGLLTHDYVHGTFGVFG